MALNVSMVRRDGVPSDQWGYPTRLLTAYQISGGGGTAVLGAGISWTPADGYMWYVASNDNDMEIWMYDGAAWRGPMAYFGETALEWFPQMVTFYQFDDTPVNGTWRVTNGGAGNVRYAATHRRMV